MKRTHCQLLSAVERSVNLLSSVAASVTGNIAQIEGRMGCTKYQQILEVDLTQSVKKLKLKTGWLLPEDNDPKPQNPS